MNDDVKAEIPADLHSDPEELDIEALDMVTGGDGSDLPALGLVFEPQSTFAGTYQTTVTIKIT
jgi:hypothetical protein